MNHYTSDDFPQYLLERKELEQYTAKDKKIEELQKQIKTIREQREHWHERYKEAEELLRVTKDRLSAVKAQKALAGFDLAMAKIELWRDKWCESLSNAALLELDAAMSERSSHED